jgi:DNA-binding transcriptional ArsR family regulator
LPESPHYCILKSMEAQIAEAPWHPDLDALNLSDVLKAFADPTRLAIIVRLAETPSGELSCREIGCATKQLATHHLRILREAGVTATREEGRQRFTRLRREAMDVRFPGLLDSVITSANKI